MTAQELHELVKDVPECVPEQLHYRWNLHGPKTEKRWHYNDVRVLPLHAADLIAMHTMRMMPGCFVMSPLCVRRIVDRYKSRKAAQ
jgi:hypothetical protein